MLGVRGALTSPTRKEAKVGFDSLMILLSNHVGGTIRSSSDAKISAASHLCGYTEGCSSLGGHSSDRR